MNDKQSNLKIVKFVNGFKSDVILEIVHADNAQEVLEVLQLKYPDVEFKDIYSIYNYFQDFKVEHAYPVD